MEDVIEDNDGVLSLSSSPPLPVPDNEFDPWNSSSIIDNDVQVGAGAESHQSDGFSVLTSQSKSETCSVVESSPRSTTVKQYGEF